MTSCGALILAIASVVKPVVKQISNITLARLGAVD